MFDTLVRLDRERLPACRIAGREVRSSAPVLHAILAPLWPEVGLEAFYEALLWSYQEAERQRGETHREVPAQERLGLLYGRLGVPPEAVPAAVTERLLATHMACLAAVARPMPGQPSLLARLHGDYRLGVVSNFDYSPTVRLILEQGGTLSRFETVVVSDAVGWRKPHPTIFEAAVRDMGVAPGECLFVGDRPDIDVLGAKAMGMGAAWLNVARDPLPPGLAAPDFDVGGLAELQEILDGNTP
jgi:putative hydrolase of the HAD superfamily